jgi:bifunctional ADP-heptose synthase (sugar kinase/adenylyltransferase)
MNYIDIIKEKIFPDYIAFSEVLNLWKSSGDKVIFTNGCFDLVHRGTLIPWQKRPIWVTA